MADPSPAFGAIPSILVAIREMTPSRISTVLDRAAAAHGLDVTVDEVLFPTLRVVGTFWASGTLNIAHEHLLSNTFTRWVHTQRSTQQTTRTGPVLLAAGPQDLHVLGLDCLELLLTHRGVDVLNLGGQVPIDSVAAAARSAGAAAVVVSSHKPTVTTQAMRAVHALHDAGLPVYYAGSAFESQHVREHSPGHPLDAPLRHSADLLTRRTTPTPGTTGAAATAEARG